MRVLISGASGLVGSALEEHLRMQGDSVGRLVRRPDPERPDDVVWDPSEGVRNPDALEGYDAVVHLAGENIASGRWNPERKQRIRDSRVLGTRGLVDALRGMKVRPGIFVCASAVGLYGDRKEEILTEASEPGRGFLPEVCQEWEAETRPAAEAGMRVVNLRIGIVLSRDGGALAKMLPPFQFGVGGKIGSGRQYMSWVSLQDVVGIIDFSLRNEKIEGPVNVVSPGPVTNQEFSKALGSALSRPALFPLPAPVARLALGEMAEDLLLASIRVHPEVLQREGYPFRHAELSASLPEILDGQEAIRRLPDGTRELSTSCWLPVDRDKLFEFFCDPKNLERLTPPWLRFRIHSQSDPHIQEGTEFEYRLRIHGLPVRWKSRIESWRPGREFVDVQLSGPYALWHHTHRFEDHNGGTLMTDKVRFRLPGGRIGNVLGGPFVEGDVRKIFRYRKDVISTLF